MEQIQKYPGNSEYLRNGVVEMMIRQFKLFILNIKLTLIKYLKVKKTATGLEKALEKPDTFKST